MLKLKSVILAGLMALPLAAFAQPAAHDWEVELGGQGSANTEFRAERGRPGGQFGAQLGLSYYLTDNFEVGIRQGFDYATSGTWSGSTAAAFDYNFIMGKFVPFIGASAGYEYDKHTSGVNDRDSWAFGPEGGVKFYLQDKAYLFGRGTYNIPTRGRGALANGTWRLAVGLGLNL